jgi:hypothetical protein
MIVFKHINTFSLFVTIGSPGMSVRLPLQFITEDTNGRPNEYFITDIEDFKNGLFIYPVNRIYP